MCVLCWQFLTESHWTDRRFEDHDPTTTTAGDDHERARRRARPLMSNCCFSNKDSATTTRAPLGRMSLAMVASKWTTSMSR